MEEGKDQRIAFEAVIIIKKKRGGGGIPCFIPDPKITATADPSSSRAASYFFTMAFFRMIRSAESMMMIASGPDRSPILPERFSRRI
jgi:hypothetical protein